MHIKEYKEQFEAAMEAASELPRGAAEQAWVDFKRLARESISDPYMDEISFGVGIGYKDESKFKVWFTRLVDTDPRTRENTAATGWSTADIEGTFTYSMTPELWNWLSQFEKKESWLEESYRSCDDENLILSKVNKVFSFGDNIGPVWSLIRELIPLEIHTHFWLH